MSNTFVFDLDGTIVVNGAPISAAIAQQLESLATAHQVIFASARPIRDMLPLLPQSLHHCMMVGCNGSMAWQQGEFLFSHCFEAHQVISILEHLSQSAIPYVLDGKWHYAISTTPNAFHQYIADLSQAPVSAAEIIAEGVSKILVLESTARAELERLLSEQQINFSLHHHKSDNIFDITPQETNKYLALKKLGIDFNTTYAFGNDANDFVLLRNAQVAVFLGDKQDFTEADFYGSVNDIPELIAAVNRVN